MGTSTVIPWSSKHRLLGWMLFGIFMVAFVLFFVSYTGNSWYVVPVENIKYPPDLPVDPGAATDPLNFGLFYLCLRGHCKYDLRMDYFVVGLLPQRLGIQYAYQQYRTPCMAIVTIAAAMSILALGAYLVFLSAFSLSHLAGYAAGGLEILGGVFALIGVIIFGQQFRGATIALPFGWSFGLMIVAFLMLIINGIVTIVITITIHRSLGSRGGKIVQSTSGDDSSRLMSRSF